MVTKSIKKINTKVLTKICLTFLAVTPLVVANSASVFLWQEPEAPEVFND